VNLDVVARTENMPESEITFVFRESPEGGYEARAIGHSIFTQGETLEELQKMASDAVRCHFDSDTLPRIILQQKEYPYSSA
jgi:hypothetical protein